MMNMFKHFHERIAAAIEDAAREGAWPRGLDTSRIAVEPPREAAHGDISTNAALVLTNAWGASDGAEVCFRDATNPKKPGLTWVVQGFPNGVCRSVDLELFFPVKGGTALPAKTVCRNCPAIADCLLDALGAPWVEGVWGGTSHRDRIRLRRELPLDDWTERELRAFAARFADQVRAMDTDPEPKDQT